MKTLCIAISTSTIILAISGCATSPIPNQSDRLDSIVPNKWIGDTEQSPVESDWVRSFEDTTLSILVKEAVENNFGLDAANYQVKASEAAARISGSSKRPQLNLGLSAAKQKTRLSSANFQAFTTESRSLAAGAQWEIDIWSKVSNAHSGAIASYEASQYEYEALKLSLAGQVAKAWFFAIEAKNQWQLAADTAMSFESNLKSLEKRYDRGLISGFDLRLTRAQTATAQATVQNTQVQLDSAIRQLESLLGRYPSGKLEVAEALPALKSTPPAGLPSDLLTRRPDIMAQERQLASVAAQSKVANKNWLPRLALTGSGGATSDRLADLLDEDFSVWSIIGDLSAPVFQGGRLKAEREQASFLESAQLSRYKSTVQTAFQEAEIALNSESNLFSQEDATTIAANENREAERQSWDLYNRGLVDITSVLDSQRRSFTSQSQLISIKTQRLSNRVDLYLALGGGFEH